ncbi:MAG: heme ABC exporter ATP-binding protein CcmA [Deltaproteobacteria bacterium]|nr:heme ABC exporter ATP-binding protein CcmA [Deltaproteobacteria bacterium]
MTIELQKIRHRYVSKWALKDIHFSAKSGECIALLGPNGCGKSTLLKIMATLLSPSAGEGEILGHNLQKGVGAIRKKMQWLGHELGLYKTLTAGENLKFAANMRGEKISLHCMEEVLAQVGLAGLKDKPVGSFSTGMRKRLALAKILSMPCELILLDEPHTNLDRIGKILMNKLIAEWKREGITVVLASHDHPEVLPLCDKALVLNAGHLAWFGNVKEMPGEIVL